MKTFRLFSMAALALMMAACSSEDNEILQNTQQPGTMHFTATIAAPSGDATTRTAYTEDGTTINVKWEVGDHIALVHNGVVDEAEVTAVDGSGNATIEATITGSPSDDDDVYLAYPANAVVSATPYETLPFTPNPTTFNKVKNQDGTLEFIQNNLDFRMGSGKLAVSGSDVSLKGSVSIPSLICIWKLTLQDNTSTPLNATQLKFINNTYTQAKATSAAKSEYYLCVVPSFIPDASGTFSFEATVGSDTYTFSKTGLSLTEGMYYQSTVKMAALPTVTLTPEQIGSNLIGGGEKTIGDITIALSGDAYFNYIKAKKQGLMRVEGDIDPLDPEPPSAEGTFTFTSSAGKIKRIDINHKVGSWWGSGAGWPDGTYDVSDNSTFTWSGTPAASVQLKGSHGCSLTAISSFVFTLEE